jgi:hypothetical protein
MITIQNLRKFWRRNKLWENIVAVAEAVQGADVETHAEVEVNNG